MYKMNKDLSNVRLEKLFIKFKEITLLNNNQLVVVHIPLSTRYNENNNQELDNKKNELSKILKENNIKFLDFTNHVKEKKLYKDIYRFDKEILEKINFHPIKKRHFNKQGYQELVKFILKNIE